MTPVPPTALPNPAAFAAAGRGEASGQRALYDAFAPQVFGVCRRYGASYEDAEDLAQETWLRAFAALGDCRSAEGFGGWLRRVAVTTCLKALRKRGLRLDAGATARLAAGELPLPPAFATAPAVLDAMSAAELVAHVTSLPEGYRAVFNLVAVEGYTHAEAAEALGISLSTSRSQLTRARTALQRRLRQLAAVCL